MNQNEVITRVQAEQNAQKASINQILSLLKGLTNATPTPTPTPTPKATPKETPKVIRLSDLTDSVQVAVFVNGLEIARTTANARENGTGSIGYNASFGKLDIGGVKFQSGMNLTVVGSKPKAE